MRRWAMRFAGIFVLLFTAAASAAFDVPALMERLAAAPAGEARYVEERHSPLLVAPAESAGTLRFERPDVIEKNMERPRREGLRIAGDELTLTRAGKARRIPLSSEPMIAAFAASLRGVLAGNAALLREHYRLALTGSEAGWTLELTPVDAAVLRYVERIVVSGRDGKVSQVEVRETGGDRSVMRVK